MYITGIQKLRLNRAVIETEPDEITMRQPKMCQFPHGYDRLISLKMHHFTDCMKINRIDDPKKLQPLRNF